MNRLSPTSSDSGFDSCFPDSPFTSSVCSKTGPQFAPSTPLETCQTLIEPREETADTECADCTNAPSTSFATPEEPRAAEVDNEANLEENRRFMCSCRWGGCLELRKGFDLLYDHVVEDHIRTITKPESCVLNSSDDEEDDFASCRWKECRLHLPRGDLSKKLKWLEEHYRTRHSKQARPYKCFMDGCSLRFQSTKILEEHIQNGHINRELKEKKAKRNAKKEAPKGCFGWMNCMYIPPENRGFSLDENVVDQISRVNRFIKKNRFQIVPLKRDVVGSKKRKTPGYSRYQYVAYNGEEKTEKPGPSAAEKADIFAETPDWFGCGITDDSSRFLDKKLNSARVCNYDELVEHFSKLREKRANEKSKEVEKAVPTPEPTEKPRRPMRKASEKAATDILLQSDDFLKECMQRSPQKMKKRLSVKKMAQVVDEVQPNKKKKKEDPPPTSTDIAKVFKIGETLSFEPSQNNILLEFATIAAQIQEKMKEGVKNTTDGDLLRTAVADIVMNLSQSLS
ncbi:unnamed protein product [Caenorhabditis auriculariae]|uniref:C2H2-type domain-containing protein n=1 Tax=Caenorhabditis auriculariae TaxID=2777116 RepID=A0A8S1HMB5_9PELO|nr:unnamed protein product [Caenorhabditis auriculariae]